MLATQDPFWKQVGKMTHTNGTTDVTGTAESLWDQARQQSQEWANMFGARMAPLGTGDGIAGKTLQKMMDPGQFL